MNQDESTRSAALDIKVKQAPPDLILQWLSKGWRDVRTAGSASLLHGLIVSILSIAITAIPCSTGNCCLAPYPASFSSARFSLPGSTY